MTTYLTGIATNHLCKPSLYFPRQLQENPSLSNLSQTPSASLVAPSSAGHSDASIRLLYSDGASNDVVSNLDSGLALLIAAAAVVAPLARPAVAGADDVSQARVAFSNLLWFGYPRSCIAIFLSVNFVGFITSWSSQPQALRPLLHLLMTPIACRARHGTTGTGMSGD